MKFGPEAKLKVIQASAMRNFFYYLLCQLVFFLFLGEKKLFLNTNQPHTGHSASRFLQYLCKIKEHLYTFVLFKLRTVELL